MAIGQQISSRRYIRQVQLNVESNVAVVDSRISLSCLQGLALNGALNSHIVQSIRTAKRQCHATFQKSSWYSDQLPFIGDLLASRGGPSEIEHHFEGFPIRSCAGYILPATAVTGYHGRVCCSRTRNRRRHPWPSAQVPPEESRTGENNARHRCI